MICFIRIQYQLQIIQYWQVNPSTIVFRSILAIIAVVTVDTPVMCMELYQQYYPPAYLLYSESVSHLLLLTNSSVNFLIYCVVATR